jgi:hypothetical protein
MPSPDVIVDGFRRRGALGTDFKTGVLNQIKLVEILGSFLKASNFKFRKLQEMGKVFLGHGLRSPRKILCGN